VPLLLVNAAHGQAERGPAAPLVVAVDGTPAGAASLPIAVRCARALGSEILLLRVVAPPSLDENAATLGYVPTALADAQRYLDRLAARVNACGVPAQGRALFGPVAGTIAAVAEQVHAGAIALSTQGLRGAAHLVRGSLAEGLLRAESCPILLVRRDAAGTMQPLGAPRSLPGAQQIAGGDAILG
jgi:nucleotide-binding universal stress UspA family protein